ncbi:MAG: hypothetical protein CL946_00155 [Ectothiorhodospiraceae bacterium]|nr:hypothetical protein [Ectothiorhodospiraceae bacterium]
MNAAKFAFLSIMIAITALPIQHIQPQALAQGDVKLEVFVSEQQIAVRMDNKVQIRGLQFEFTGIDQLPEDADKIQTIFGPIPGPNNPKIREHDKVFVLLAYDAGGTTVKPGQKQIVFVLNGVWVEDPFGFRVKNIVAADKDNQPITNYELALNFSVLSDVDEVVNPSSFALQQNYPNPFNPSTTIQFSNETRGFAEIQIFNSLGRKIRTLHSGDIAPGTHTLSWDGRSDDGHEVASGMYNCRLISGEFVQTRRMMLLR